MENQVSCQSVNPRAEYMREYQKKRYNENLQQSRQYKNSLRYKRLKNVSPEDIQTLGPYLSDYKKVEAILDTLPAELIERLINNAPLNVVMPAETP